MRKTTVIIALICAAFFSCGDQSTGSKSKTANIVLDGSWTQGMTSYDSPVFNGFVKNTGNGVGYNCKIEIQCFSDSGKVTIIDTASGFPADLGDIAPGQRAAFDAVCFKLDSWSQVKSTDYKITWLNR